MEAFVIVYQELKTTDVDQILTAIRGAVESDSPTSVMLSKHGDLYVAKIASITEASDGIT